MFYALSWFGVFSLLALWSLTVWALHAVAVWAISQAGALGGVATGMGSGLEGLQLPAWLAMWVPAETAQAVAAMMEGLAPLVQSLLQAVPFLAGGLTVISWVIWGLGAGLLVLVGVALHLLIAFWRRRGGGGGSAPRPQVVA